MPKKAWIGIVLFSALLVYQFFTFNVLQDDAFISFRYVKNFLAGHGLVFNIGERVEGYTNFLWIMLLALLTKLGLPTIGTARVLGILFSIGTLAVAAWGAYKYHPKRSWLWTVSVPLLLAANGSLAYWAGSGLETGLFTCLVAAGAVSYFFNSPLLSSYLLTLAALVRPEAILFALLFGIIGIILKRNTWRTSLIFWGVPGICLLPYAVFKYTYFGSLLPNSFYAKTGFSQEYWQSGLEYFFLFIKQYGLYGISLLLPLLFWKKLHLFSRFSLLVFLGYSLYVVVIGGDVLQAHRFFVPALVFLYFPQMELLYHSFERKAHKNFAFAAAVLLFGLYSLLFPLSYLKSTAFGQRISVEHMRKAGRFFASDPGLKSFALSAIGALSYYAGERRVIDMLGLTDPRIAKKPETIEGLISNWRERRYNAGYLLSQKPDVILFSTGLKPSSLAEKALFLYPDFRLNYRLEFLYQEGSLNNYYRRFRDLPADNKPDLPARFVNLFTEGVNRRNSGEEIPLLQEALRIGGKDCSVLYTTLGSFYFSAGIYDSAEICFKKAMELDLGGSGSRYNYRQLLHSQKRFAEARSEDSILYQTVRNYSQFLELGHLSR